MQDSTEFSIDVPADFNFAFDVIDERATTDRNRLAMLWVNEQGEERRITYRDLSVESNKYANYFLSKGIKKGDRVMLMLSRIPEWWFCVVGLMKVGAIFCPSAVSLTSKDLKYRCESGDIKMVIANESNVAKFDEIRAEVPMVEHFVAMETNEHTAATWDDLHDEIHKQSHVLAERPTTRQDDEMLIYFTSGTTGYPKMVMHRQSYALAHRATAKYWYDLNSNDIQWTITDTGWAKAAWGALFSQWNSGATVFLYEYQGRFDGDIILSLIEKYGITIFCAPPTAYRMLILEKFENYDFSGLRRCLSAGEPLNPEVIDAWQKGTNLGIYEGFGQTETICVISTSPGMEAKSGAIGKPVPLYEIDVLDDDLHSCDVEQEGHVAIKVKPVHPIGIFDGYVANDKANQKCFVGDWYLTGDKAYKDEDGYFWFVGRSDDVIKSSGYRIGPFEVESALIEHPAVIESAVIGVPDELKGQVVKAFIVLGEGYTASDELAVEIKDHVAKVTAPFKKPKYVQFVTELPKTVSGKIRRVELRQQHQTDEA